MARLSVSANNWAQKGVWTVTTIIVGLALSLAGCDGTSSDTGTETANTTPKLDYGTKVSFGKGGNSEAFRVAGWSPTEDKFTWSEGTVAVLKMVTAPTDHPVVLKMMVAALIKEPELPAQPVEVSINGQKIAEWQVGNTAELTALIPPEISKTGGTLTITFNTPKATSPKALGMSTDARILGICCYYLELSKA